MTEIPARVFDADPKEYAIDGTKVGSVKGSPLRHIESKDRSGELADADAKMQAAIGGFLVDPKDMDAKLMESMYPQYGDEAQRKLAFELYVDGDKSLDDIATAIKTPLRTVAKWAENGRWYVFFDNMAKTMRDLERSRLSINRVKRREKILADQLDLAAKIRESAAASLDEAETAGQVKASAEAAKLASDMEVRALGVGESGGVDEADHKEAADAKGRTSFIFNFPGGLPPVKKTEVIDV